MTTQPTSTEPAASPLLARRKLFGNPTYAQAGISPDGRFLSWLAPDAGVLNVWIAPAGDLTAARCITADRKRGIQFHTWAYDKRHVLYMQDQAGDENWHVYAADVERDGARDLTPLESVNATIVGLSQDRPDTIVVGLNARDPRWHDLYEIDIASGERRLLLENLNERSDFTLDDTFRLRFSSQSLAGGGSQLFRHDGGEESEFLRLPHEDAMTTGLMGMNRAGDAVFLMSSLDRDRSALFRVECASGRQQLLAEPLKSDLESTLVDPVTGEVEAIRTHHLRPEWTALARAAAARADLALLTERLGEAFNITAQTADNRRWIVLAFGPRNPGRYHLFDRDRQSLTALFDVRPELADADLRPTQPVVIPSRDGLDLVSYLTLPGGTERPASPLPLVLLVHGGPWARDVYGFDARHQWLTNRGYAVLSVNFRGSTGFGKAFVNAGDHEWARKMHDDLLDGVAWAVSERIADPRRVAIMGTSYGGYAALAALAFTPEAFTCGVAAVGPSNLETLLATVPPYWTAFFETLARRVGDPRTEEGRALLRERSPLHHAHAIRRPLLIGQGANDPRVKQAESDQIVDAMKRNLLPVTYVLYPDEGHGFVRPENRLSWLAVVEAFLAAHVGGRAEPIGADFEGASLRVVEGASHVAGLSQREPTG